MQEVDTSPETLRAMANYFGLRPGPLYQDAASVLAMIAAEAGETDWKPDSSVAVLESQLAEARAEIATLQDERSRLASEVTRQRMDVENAHHYADLLLEERKHIAVALERAEKAEAERDDALAHARRLKQALEPIATAWDYAGTLFDRPVMDDVLCTVARSCIEAGHFRAAQAIITEMEPRQ